MSENIVARITTNGDLFIKGQINQQPGGNFSFNSFGDLSISGLNELSAIDGLISVNDNVLSIKGNIITSYDFELDEGVPLPTEPIIDGLILWYEFRDKTNSDPDRQTIQDLSGSGHNGTLHNFLFTEDSGYINGEGLKFDGVDDSITSVDSTEPLPNSTFVFNFIPHRFPESGEDYSPGIVSNYELFEGHGHSAYILEGLMAIDYTDLEGYNSGIHFDNLILNQVNRVAITSDGTSFCLYVNGVLQSCIESSYTPGFKKFIIGSWALDYAYEFDGIIQNVLIYDRVLTDAEIRHNNNVEIGRDAQ